MNLLFLNSATTWGGNEKWTLAAAAGLAERGHTVYLGCRSSQFEERAPHSRLQFLKYPFANNLDFLTIARLIQTIRRKRIDVLVPTKQREYFLGGLAARPFKNVKVVARFGLARPIQDRRNRYAFCRLFDGVIVNSKCIVELLAQTPQFDPTLCKVIYNGVELPEFSPDTRHKVRTELGLRENEFAICGVGGLTSQKGFDLAITAFSAVAAMAPNVRLVLVGEDARREEYLQLAVSRGVGDKVLFTGFRKDVSDILHAVDLFWLTSRSEGMPNVLLEAMAAGRTACAFSIAGVPELLTHGEQGIVVDFGDTSSLAQQTLMLINDPALRSAMQLSARETVERRFSMGAMVETMERYLQEVMSLTRVRYD